MIKRERLHGAVSNTAVLLALIVFVVLKMLGLGGGKMVMFGDPRYGFGLSMDLLISLGGAIAPILFEKFAGRIPGLADIISSIAGAQTDERLDEILDNTEEILDRLPGGEVEQAAEEEPEPKKTTTRRRRSK